MTTPPGSSDQPGQWGTQPPLPGCVRHPDRPTGLRCTRCDRPACPDCLREASVGYQCVDCVNEGRRTTRRATTVAGAGYGRSAKLIVVPVLIVLNLAIFALTAYQARDLMYNDLSSLFVRWELWPPITADGEWYRLLTSGFLHRGPVHIALNAMALYLIGRELEPLFGRLRFIAVYLVSLLGGGVAVFMFGDERVPVAGASGAVFGLMGALVVVVYRLRLNPSSVLAVVAVNIFISVAVPGISLLGHLGGLVIGALATIGLVYAPAKNRTAWQAGTISLLVVALIGIAIVRDAQFGELTCRSEPTLQCEQVIG